MQVIRSYRAPAQSLGKNCASLCWQCLCMRRLTCQFCLQERLIQKAGAVSLEAGLVEMQAWHQLLIVLTVS